jgi:hypothetical protein
VRKREIEKFGSRAAAGDASLTQPWFTSGV